MRRGFKKGNSKALSEFFFSPGEDAGMMLLPTSLWDNSVKWERALPGRIAAVGASGNSNFNETANLRANTLTVNGILSHPMRYRSIPVVCRAIAFDGSLPIVNGKYLASGAAGHRMRNGFKWASGMDLLEADEQLEFFFEGLREKFTSQSLPVTSSELPRIAVLPSRNFTNYFHFLTETLPYIFLISKLSAHIDKLILHSESLERASFVESMIQLVAPDMLEKIRFSNESRVYDCALTVFSPIYLYPEKSFCTAKGEHTSPLSQPEYAKVEHTMRGHTLERCSYDEALLEMRNFLFEKADSATLFQPPGENILLRRKPGVARGRTLSGGEELEQELLQQGFAPVFFEDLSPLEQVATVKRSKIILGVHGAGFANMIFGSPESSFIEIGTVQTLNRWGDFIPLAHLSRCRYYNFVLDYDSDNSELHPEIVNFGVVAPRLSRRSKSIVLDFAMSLIRGVKFGTHSETYALHAMALYNSGDVEAAMEIIEKTISAGLSGLALETIGLKVSDQCQDFAKSLLLLNSIHQKTPPTSSRLERLCWLNDRFSNSDEVKMHLSCYRAKFPEEFSKFLQKFPRFRNRI